MTGQQVRFNSTLCLICTKKPTAVAHNNLSFGLTDLNQRSVTRIETEAFPRIDN